MTPDYQGIARDSKDDIEGYRFRRMYSACP
jgi:hypothetical protein